MKVALASDHAGLEYKEEVKNFLTVKGYEIEDFGAHTYSDTDDYPDFIKKAAQYISQNGGFAIVFGKSGAGEAIVANKYKDIRAVLGVNEENVILSREHNDANVLSIGSVLVSIEEAKKLTDLFLNTAFSNEQRHKRRIEKIKEIEDGQL